MAAIAELVLRMTVYDIRTSSADGHCSPVGIAAVVVVALRAVGLVAEPNT